MIRALMATSLSSPDLIQLAAASGFDCVIFDCEHFAIAEVELSTLCELALLRGLTPVVRTLATREMIGKVLDLGAVGVMIPRTRSVEEARELIRACYFPPLGDRGFSGHSASARLHTAGHPKLTPMTRSRLTAAQNDSTFVIVQVETASLAAQVDRLSKEPGIDVILVGPSDLALAQGSPDSSADNPAIAGVLNFPDTEEFPLKGAPMSGRTTADWRSSGVRFLIAAHDIDLLASGLQQLETL
jgi:2-keto-3-deoxy-L-rhamnonate aldolase RhmA